MSTSYPVPEDELARFADLAREMSGLTVLFHSRIAEQAGVSATDYKCLDIAMRVDEPLTAGQIAKMSGLSTGAVTGVIDRLEKHGLARRIRDPHDRRKVLVEVTKVDEAKFAHLFAGALASVRDVLSRFSPEERETIERFQRASVERFRAEAFAGLDKS